MEMDGVVGGLFNGFGGMGEWKLRQIYSRFKMVLKTE